MTNKKFTFDELTLIIHAVDNLLQFGEQLDDETKYVCRQTKEKAKAMQLSFLPYPGMDTIADAIIVND